MLISCVAIQSNLILDFKKKKCRAKNLACRSDITALGPTMNIFNYNAVWSENRTHNISNDERTHYLLRNSYRKYFNLLGYRPRDFQIHLRLQRSS